jgi:hypothetical protein
MLADFLEQRLPYGYRICCKGEIVDYLDHRSGEVDIVIFDRVRNALLSEEPIWITAESLLAYIEVKSVLTREELRKSYIGAKKINSLRPFKRSFTLAGLERENQQLTQSPRRNIGNENVLRCFRTLFAYETDLNADNWLSKEWSRIMDVTRELRVEAAAFDRILVLSKGMINPVSQSGTDQFELSSILQQWFTNLVNFLARENARRPAGDWQNNTKKRLPGWKRLARLDR